jgi:hypothetical protein
LKNLQLIRFGFIHINYLLNIDFLDQRYYMLKIATIPVPIVTKYKSLFGQVEPIVKNPIWLNCFARGVDGRVYRKWFDNNAGWKPSDYDWQPLGGVITDYPVAVAWSSNRLDVFARGVDGALYHNYGNNNNETLAGWESLGGQILGSPAVVSWGKNRIDIFARGLDNGIYHKWWDGMGWKPSQLDWQPLGGGTSESPAAVTWSEGRLDVFVLGLDRNLHHIYGDGNPDNWSRWEKLSDSVLQGSPTVVSWGPDRLDIFVRDSFGSILHKAWDGVLPWKPSQLDFNSTNRQFDGSIIESVQTSDSPAAVAWSKGRLDVFIRGQEDGVVYHNYGDGSPGNWSGWESLGGVIQGSPTVVSWGPDRLDVFARGMDDGVWHKWWDGVFPWKGWDSLDKPVSPSIVVSTKKNQQGGAIRVSGKGFTPGGRVEFYVENLVNQANPFIVGRDIADAQGHFSEETNFFQADCRPNQVNPAVIRAVDVETGVSAIGESNAYTC